MNYPYRSCLAAALVVLTFSSAKLSAQSGDDTHAGPTMNYHVIDERLATGGHFVADGLGELAAQGLEVVIDLRDEPPRGQQEKLAALGIQWIHIPVEWEDPQQVDFERFSAAMEANADTRVLVQCQANYRASAMTYLYRVKVVGVPEAVAATDLDAVWIPEGRWRDYLDSILEP